MTGAAAGGRRRGVRRRIGKGPLMVIAALLAAAGALHIGLGASALARGAAMAAGAAERGPGATPAACPVLPDSAALLAALQNREQQVAQREAALADRAQALDLASGEIGRRLETMKATEAQLAATIARANSAADEDVTRLVAVYQAMKPKEAAPLFAAMAPDFAAGFLGRMTPEASAAVMAAMDPKQVYAISVILAGRNAGAPRN